MAHKPTDKERKAVEQMAAVGIPQLDIAAILDITDKTLRKHYAREIATATSRANANIGGVLYRKAMDGDLTACIFWMKTRAKWNDRPEENREQDVQPIKIEIVRTDASRSK